ncbi:MAG: hypothetical protein ACE5G5_10335, partial [Candidatus Methylomirabilales bacterium]
LPAGHIHLDRRRNRLALSHPLQALELLKGLIEGSVQTTFGQKMRGYVFEAPARHQRQILKIITPIQPAPELQTS